MTQIVPIRLKWSNAYLLKGRQPILVDTGSPGDKDTLIQALEREQVSLNDLSLILHTHGHGDHCGCTQALKQLSNVSVAIHQADHDMLMAGQNGELNPTRLTGWLMRPLVDLPFPGLTADIVIKDELSLEVYGVAAQLIFTPGHTVGSISIVTAEGEAIVGDLLMGGYLGSQLWRHKPRYHYFTYDLSVIRWSLKKVLRLSATKFHVGHGGPLSRQDILQQFGSELDL